ncbi:MAG: putative esterase [Pseudohongiellaceae bacterium]|jgi:predicted esterase
MRFSRLLTLTAFLFGLMNALQAAEERVFLNDGDAIKLLFFTPEPSAEPPRLAILISGGSNDEYMAQVQYWIGKEMVNRGWAVAVPISPKGGDYFVKETGVFPKLLEFISSSHRLHPSKPLLFGVSQGGSAALAIAAQNPKLYSGVIATPGRLSKKADFQNLDGLPIYLRIGEKDSFHWHKQLPEIVNTLYSAGANVDAGLIANGKHLFQLDWQDFDSWLEKLKQSTRP